MCESGAKIKTINGRYAIVVNGEVLAPMAFTMRSIQTETDGGLKLNPDYIKKIGESGIRLFYLITDTEWTRAGANEMLDTEARALLEAVPNAYIMIRIGLHPPVSWAENHPEECFTYSDGSRPPVKIASESLQREYPHLYSMASEAWLQDAAKALEETFAFLDARPYADRIIGFFFAAGGTSEWYYLLNQELPDGRYGEFSQAFKRYFSKYLKEKYGTDENLQSAWKRRDVTIENPAIPDGRSRYYAHRLDKELVFDGEDPLWKNQEMPGNGTNSGNFLDVDNHMCTFDFYRALHLATADSQRFFSGLVKRRYAGKKLAGAFYGSYGCTDFFDGSTAGGVMRILNDENMDFLAAPGAYSNRNPGGFTGQREMLDSFRLHGKLFFAEEDTRTHLDTPYYRDLFDCYTVSDSLNVLKRDFGRIIAAGEYAWWFDQLIGGGRYRCEEMYALFARQQKIAGKIYSETQGKRNEIAFIYDEESIHAVSDITTKETVEYFRNYEIAKIGAGADEYFHNDMSLEGMPDYKLYVFFNTFVLSDDERAAIRKKLAKNGAVAVWVYASGLINPDRAEKLNVNYVSELTGMTMKRLDERWSSRFKWEKGLEIFGGLNKDAFYGDKDRPTKNNILVSQREIKTYLCPVIYPCDASAEVLARYAGNGLPAVAMKRAEGYTSIYYGAKTMRSDFVRAAARFAGAHIYCESDDVFYYGNGLLTIHASATGKKTIRLPKRCAVSNAYDGTDHGITDTIELTMNLGETASFYVKEREA